MKNFDDVIAKLQKQIEELEAEKKAFAELSPIQQLAAALHDSQCGWNHTDGCSWHYEVHKGIDDWNGRAHSRWLGKAKRVKAMLPDLTVNEIIAVSKAIKG